MLQKYNSSPTPAMQWLIRGAAGLGTHGITQIVSHKWQPVSIAVGVFLGAELSTSRSVLRQATGHGLLGGSVTGIISYLVAERTSGAPSINC